MARKALTLGIFGFGCVGQGLWQTLERSNGINATVKRICIKDPSKDRSIAEHYFTTNSDLLLNDPEINVIVELINDADAAWEIVKSALNSGKAVVTANKKMIAEHFEELIDLQAETGLPVLYESACCASIPIIRKLEEYYDNDFLVSLEGIFNGSTNYILDRVFEEGLTFPEALEEAQAKGFAELDPTLDVEAFDPRYKLAILTAHAFGQWVEPQRILKHGISGLGAPEFRYAKEKGLKLRLVAKSRKIGEGIHASVLPQFVDKENPLYGVNRENNGVLVEGAFSQVQFFKGKGAGSLPTGSAVLSDISALGYDYRYEYRKARQQSVELPLVDVSLRVYFRYQDPEVLDALPFLVIDESYNSLGFRYVTGRVTSRALATFLSSPQSRGTFVAELSDSVWFEVAPAQARQDLVLV